MEAHDGGKTRLYFNVWGVLLALTLVEVAATWLPVSRGKLLAVLVSLAIVKATLVAVYYMHLRWERLLLGAIALLPFPLATLFAVVLMLENGR